MIDPIQAKLTSDAIATATGPASGALKKWGQRKYDKFIATSTNALSEYIHDSVKVCETVKNILYKDQVASTDEKYVNVTFSSKRGDASDESLITALNHRRHILVKGRGGAGKTMFTKWVILRLVDTILHHQQVPIYIELRDIRHEKDFDHFEDYIFDRISNHRTKTNKNQFLEGLKAGLFVLVLDAADEISKTNRSRILRLVNEFERRYPEVGILLTSRDFPDVEGLSGFEIFETKPLTQLQALEILGRLDYREKVKEYLVQDILDGKYQRHSFFLENPLLVTILLLTFDQSRDIPTKRSAFYKRAFETLYERHDSSKDVGFARDHHAGLPMDEFEGLFSVFCYGTYINSVYDFSESDLINNFNASLEQLEMDERADLIARDAIESVCLLVKEGHDVVFVHRSFQEYFTALYIKNYKGDDIGDIIAEALQNGQGEHTLEFIFELDRFSLEKHYILPKIQIINKKVKKLDFEKQDHRIKAISFLFSQLRVSATTGELRGLRFSQEIDNMFLLSIASIYPETDTLRIFSHEGSMLEAFKTLPLEKMKASRSSKLARRDNGETVLEVKFSPTSLAWVSETEMLNQVAIVFSDLRKLENRLETAYSDQKSEIRKRFAGFVRE